MDYKGIWRTIYRGPWPYWVGAVVLAVLNIAILWVRQSPWGVTTNIEEWAQWLAKNMGLVSQSLSLKQLLSSSGTYLNLGLILGAFWATLTASQARFRPIRQKKFFFSALIGGFLMGYGARIAYGCNIGAFINSIASFSLAGWIFGLFMVIGVWLGIRIMLKFLI